MPVEATVGLGVSTGLPPGAWLQGGGIAGSHVPVAVDQTARPWPQPVDCVGLWQGAEPRTADLGEDSMCYLL